MCRTRWRFCSSSVLLGSVKRSGKCREIGMKYDEIDIFWDHFIIWMLKICVGERILVRFCLAQFNKGPSLLIILLNSLEQQGEALSRRAWWAMGMMIAHRGNPSTDSSLRTGKWPLSSLIYPWTMVIFHSYVSLPKGRCKSYSEMGVRVFWMAQLEENMQQHVWNFGQFLGYP